MQYTAIYNQHWMSGSHWQSLTQFKRFTVNEGETVLDALKRECIADSTVFLFEGWPRLQGEQDEQNVTLSPIATA